MKMEFEEWWKESEGPTPLKSDLSLNTLAVVELAKKLCRQAFEAGREYEKQKNNPVEIDGIKKKKCGTIES